MEPDIGASNDKDWVYLGSGMWITPDLLQRRLPVVSRLSFVHGIIDVDMLDYFPMDEAKISDWARRTLNKIQWLNVAVPYSVWCVMAEAGDA